MATIGTYYPMRKCASKYDWDMLPHDKSWRWLGRILTHEKIRIKIWLGRVTPWKVMNMRGTYYPLKKYATKYDWDVLRHDTSCDKYAWTEKMWARFVNDWATAQAPMINTTMINTHELKKCSWANVFPLNITGTGCPIPNQGNRFPINWVTDSR